MKSTGGFYIFLFKVCFFSFNNQLSCLRESSLGKSPYSLRQLFVTILLHCCPADPKALFEEFWEAMAGEHWTKERLLRYLARKMLLNNASPNEMLFQKVDLKALDEPEEDMQPDEGQQALELPTAEQIDGIFH
jgi:hypothetical protein